MQTDPRLRSFMILLVVLAFGTAMSCGGGGDNNNNPGGSLTASFTPDTGNPGTQSLVLRSGTVSGDTFQVKVSATDIPDLFGVTFRVTYDSTKVRYVSATTSGTPIADGMVLHDSYEETILPSTGHVDITSYRLQNDTGTRPGAMITGTQDLAVITFQARAAAAGSRIEVTDPRLACGSAFPCDPGLTLTWSGGSMTAN